MKDASSDNIAVVSTTKYFKIFLLFAAVIGIAFVSFNFGRWHGVKSLASHVIRTQVQARMVWAHAVRKSVKLASLKHISQEEFEQCIGPVKPADRTKHSEARPTDTHIYYHPPSQYMFYLRFTEDGLMGHHCPDDRIVSLSESVPDRTCWRS